MLGTPFGAMFDTQRPELLQAINEQFQVARMTAISEKRFPQTQRFNFQIEFISALKAHIDARIEQKGESLRTLID